VTIEFPLALAAQKYGECVAYQDAKCSVTYSRLFDEVALRASQLATESQSQRFAFCPRNDFATLVDFWAIWMTGATACPLSHRFPDERKQQVANTLDARWLPTQDITAEDNGEDNAELHLFDPDRPATVVLSSGSSGTPKAIVHSLRGHIASAQGSSDRISLVTGDRWLWSLPANHVGGLSIPIRCAFSGATLYGVPDSKLAIGQVITESGTTHVSLVPTQLQRLLDNDTDLSSLKAALIGGMAVPSTLIRFALDRGVPIHTTYGMTEMASQVATTRQLESVTESNGTALPHCEVQIADDGEILVRGESLCLGILRDGKVDPIVDEQGWFHTRDRGHLTEDHELVLRGRMDNMFISGGENIYPEAIERAILSLPNIKQAIVVAVCDQEFGARPVAFVEAASMKPEDWNTRLREVLAGFEVPTTYLPWPNEAMLAIKPDRRMLEEIANCRD